MAEIARLKELEGDNKDKKVWRENFYMENWCSAAIHPGQSFFLTLDSSVSDRRLRRTSVLG